MSLPKRKPTRLQGYDYSTPGTYFITICTHNRKRLLSSIVGEGFHTLPQNILTEICRLKTGLSAQKRHHNRKKQQNRNGKNY